MLALLIFAFHSNMHFDCHYGFLEHFARMGAIAMTAFFMLSGYALNFGYKEFPDLSSYKKFLLKRFIGIFPIYYFVSVCSLVVFGHYTVKELCLIVPYEVLGIQALFPSIKDVANNGGIWFISCLTVCYIAYPFLQWIFKQFTYRQRMIAIILLTAILLISPVTQRHFQLASIYDNPFFRLMEFSIGLLLAQVNMSTSNRYFLLLRNKALLLVVTVLLVVGVSCWDIYMQSIGLTRDYMLCSIVALPCFILMFPSLAVFKNNHLSDSWLFMYCSKLSYAFFLAQSFTWTVAYKILGILGMDSNVVKIVVSFCVCTIVAILLHELIEKPVGKFLTSKILK